MTRAEAFQWASDILDGICERELEKRDYDPASEEALRRWREEQLAEIRKGMESLVRSMMH